MSIGIFDIDDKKQIELELSYANLTASLESVFESEKTEKRCFNRVTKRFKTPKEYFMPETPNDLIFLGFMFLFVLFLLFIYYYRAVSFFVISGIVFVSAVIMKIYDNNEKKLYNSFIE